MPGPSRKDVDPQSWAAALRSLRLARGWTQEKAAESVGVHAYTWARWEGEIRFPSGMAKRLLRRTFPDHDFPAESDTEQTS